MKRSIQLTKSILTTLQLLVMLFAICIGISTSSHAQTGSLTITRTPSTMVAGQGFTVTWSSSEPTAVATKFNCVSPTGGFAGSATLAVSGSSNGTADPNWTWKDSTCEWTVVNAAGTVLARRTDIMKTVPAQVNGVTYIHTDGLGSPVAKSDAAGNLVANSRTRYEPYGMEVAGTATPTIGFTGHVNDADTGLTYMQQRYYDPLAGRFLSTDPVLTDVNSGASFNRYTYALNNPYKYIDPDGRESAMFHGTNPSYKMADTCHGDQKCASEALVLMGTVYGGAIVRAGGHVFWAFLGRVGVKEGIEEAQQVTTPAARLADKVQKLPSGQRPNTVAVIKHKDGTVTIGRNQGGVENETVQNALNNAPANCFAAQCAEINAAARALNKGRSLEGATITISNVRGSASQSGVHGTPKTPCSTCDSVLKQLGLEVK